MSRPKGLMSEAWLRVQYLDNGLSSVKIGKLLGCHSVTVRYWMKKFGIPRRSHGHVVEVKRPTQEWLQTEYWDKGRSPLDLAAEHGCSRAYIYTSLVHYGLGTRSTSEAAKKRWEDGVYGEEYLKNHSEALRQCWADGKMAKPPGGEKGYHWKGGKKTHICEECGSEFTDWDSRRFCSMVCRVKHLRGSNAPNWNGGKVARVCKQCGKGFEVYPHRVKLGEGLFCSMRCSHKWHVGPNSPNWRGGTARAPYPFWFNEGFKKQVRARDNYTCAICGKRGKTVHHIDYDKSNTVMENCITLCKSCHTKTNTSREYWQVALRFVGESRYATRI